MLVENDGSRNHGDPLMQIVASPLNPQKCTDIMEIDPNQLQSAQSIEIVPKLWVSTVPSHHFINGRLRARPKPAVERRKLDTHLEKPFSPGHNNAG